MIMNELSLQECKETYGDGLVNLYKQIKPMENETLLTCATLYVKDMIEYMSLRGLGGKPFNEFFASYQNILDSHRFFWERFQTELFITLEEAGLPHNMTNLAAGGNFLVPYLRKKDQDEQKEKNEKEEKKEKKVWCLKLAEKKKEDPDTEIKCEVFVPEKKICAIWINFLGWHFFKDLTRKYSAKLLEYHRKEDLESRNYPSDCFDVLNLSEELRRYLFTKEQYWYPLSVIFSLLLLRSKFVTVLQADV